jgi:hypothetical protein
VEAHLFDGGAVHTSFGFGQRLESGPRTLGDSPWQRRGIEYADYFLQSSTVSVLMTGSRKMRMWLFYVAPVTESHRAVRVIMCVFVISVLVGVRVLMIRRTRSDLPLPRCTGSRMWPLSVYREAPRTGVAASHGRRAMGYDAHGLHAGAAYRVRFDMQAKS